MKKYLQYQFLTKIFLNWGQIEFGKVTKYGGQFWVLGQFYGSDEQSASGIGLSQWSFFNHCWLLSYQLTSGLVYVSGKCQSFIFLFRCEYRGSINVIKLTGKNQNIFHILSIFIKNITKDQKIVITKCYRNLSGQKM